MEENELLILLCGFFAVMTVVLFIAGAYLDIEVSKLRRENKLLRRVLEDYFRLEDGRIRTSRSIAREVDRINRIPPGWDL